MNEEDIDKICTDILKDTTLYRRLPNKLKSDGRVSHTAVIADRSNYYDVPEPVKNNIYIVLSFLKNNISDFWKLAPELQKNKALVKACIEHHGCKFTHSFEQLDPSIQDDVEIALLTLPRNGDKFIFLSERLRDDKMLLQLALLNNLWAYEGASIRLKHDEDIIAMIIDRNPIVLSSLNPTLLQDKSIALRCVQSMGNMLHALPEGFQDDEEIVLEALKHRPNSFMHASDRLKDNIHIVGIACSFSKRNYYHASSRIQAFLPFILRFQTYPDPFKINRFRI